MTRDTMTKVSVIVPVKVPHWRWLVVCDVVA